MTKVIVTLTVCIVIGIIAYIRYNRQMNKIKELEERLDEYYKKREDRLKKILKQRYMNKRTLKRVGVTTLVMLSILTIPLTPWIFIGELIAVLAYMVWQITDTID